MPKFFIYEGDAYNVLDTLAPSSVDVCYTSPAPAFYERWKGKTTESDVIGTEENTGQYIQHLMAILKKVDRVLKPNGSLWLQIADYHHHSGTVTMVPEQVALNLLRNGWLLISPCVWSRSDQAIIINENKRRFVKDWETINWFVKSKDYYFNEDCGVNKTSVFDFPYVEPKKGEFVSGYPEKLVDVAIKATCPPSGTVLDPFAGTGTTGVSALKNDRYFIGIDIDGHVAAKIIERLSNTKHNP